jgi:hypothetical protein
MSDSLIVKKAIRSSKKIDLLDSIDDPQLKVLKTQKGDMGKFSKTYHELLRIAEIEQANIKARIAMLKKIAKTYTIEPVVEEESLEEIVIEEQENPIPITKKEDVAINDLIHIKDDSFAFLLINKGSMTTKIDIVKSIISYIGKNNLFIDGSKIHFAPDEKLMILLGGDEDEYSVYRLLRQIEVRL